MKTKIMKALVVLCASSLFAVSAQAATDKKVGFLTTKYCAQKGLFRDCPLETAFCGYEGCHEDMDDYGQEIKGDLVLFVHDDGQYYETKFKGKIDMGNLMKLAMNKNEVSLTGTIKGNTIEAIQFDAPPPPKKEFYKGCL